MTRPTIVAVRKCAEWLAYCLSIGWKRSDLDALKALWWKYHDERGHLKSTKAEERPHVR